MISVSYRSKKRDEPRLLQPTEFPSQEQVVGPPGRIDYHPNGPQLSQIFSRARRYNRLLISKEYREHNKALLGALDNLYTRASEHLPLMYSFPDVQVNQALDVLVPCFHQSLMSLCVGHSLTSDGLYSAAHPHLRHAFEALLIAKYCSVMPTADVYDRWVDGVELYFTNSVLKRIDSPDLIETKVLWKLLCEKSHATMWSGQPDLRLDTRKPDIAFNYALIGVLIRWAAHLYSGHILTPTAIYYGRRYRRSARTKQAQDKLRRFFKWNGYYLGEPSKRLIQEYTRAWTVK